MIEAKVIATKDNFAKIEVLSGSVFPGQRVQLSIGKRRTKLQNNLYWKFLSWCIDNGLKNQGHYSVEALHSNLKSHFLSEKTFTEGEFKALDEATTTSLSKQDFGEYFDKVNEFMLSFFGLNTSVFWEEYKDWTGN